MGYGKPFRWGVLASRLLEILHEIVQIYHLDPLLEMVAVESQNKPIVLSFWEWSIFGLLSPLFLLPSGPLTIFHVSRPLQLPPGGSGVQYGKCR